MSRTTKLLGTVSVLATLAASPAAADQLAGFAGFADLSYAWQSFDDSSSSSDDWSTFGVGGGVAFPVAEVPNLAFQLDAKYATSSGNDASQITWNLGGSIFLAFPQSRWGINVNYETVTDWGSLTNAGPFVEYYFGNITVAAKGGWLSGGGRVAAGSGNYLGAQGGGYFIPNLWLGASVTWSDLVTGSSLSGGGGIPPCFGATCGRRDLTETNFTVDAEFLVSQTFPLTVFGGYTYTDWKISEYASNPDLASGDDFNTSTFFIGVRYYLGGMGNLIDIHRNGNLRGWLRGAN